MLKCFLKWVDKRWSNLICRNKSSNDFEVGQGAEFTNSQKYESWRSSTKLYDGKFWKSSFKYPRDGKKIWITSQAAYSWFWKCHGSNKSRHSYDSLVISSSIISSIRDPSNCSTSYPSQLLWDSKRPSQRNSSFQIRCQRNFEWNARSKGNLNTKVDYGCEVDILKLRSKCLRVACYWTLSPLVRHRSCCWTKSSWWQWRATSQQHKHHRRKDKRCIEENFWLIEIRNGKWVDNSCELYWVGISSNREVVMFSKCFDELSWKEVPKKFKVWQHLRWEIQYSNWHHSYDRYPQRSEMCQSSKRVSSRLLVYWTSHSCTQADAQSKWPQRSIQGRTQLLRSSFDDCCFYSIS